MSFHLLRRHELKSMEIQRWLATKVGIECLLCARNARREEEEEDHPMARGGVRVLRKRKSVRQWQQNQQMARLIQLQNVSTVVAHSPLQHLAVVEIRVEHQSSFPRHQAIRIQQSLPHAPETTSIPFLVDAVWTSRHPPRTRRWPDIPSDLVRRSLHDRWDWPLVYRVQCSCRWHWHQE